MDTPPDKIQFSHLGIGRALASHRLRVPLNQREYRWESDLVKELFQDLQQAYKSRAYFLGSIVLTRGKDGVLEVADGQQRLATTTILIAAIRDYFASQKDEFNVNSIENEFLSYDDRAARDRLPRLTLNVDDNEFFRKRILSRPDHNDRAIEPKFESHQFIERASELAAQHVNGIVSNYNDRAKIEALLDWLIYITDGVQVILLTVPDHLNAFRMFETLNDRGAKTSQSDLLKNYLFGEAGDRIAEAQHKWANMKGVLESLGIDDVMLTYLRHLLVAQHGTTREREVYEKIKSSVSGKLASVAFLDDLAENANRYAALVYHLHPFWNSFGNSTVKIRKHVETLVELKNTQIRPLMLACVKKFHPREVEKAFRMFIAWVVRFMVAGLPTGTVEKYYAGRATEVWNGEIADAAELAQAMHRYLPDDAYFRSAFASLKVSKSHLARYYLRSLEQKLKNEPEPEWVVNNDQTVLTLEHVLPENPSAAWSHVDQETAAAECRRLGNMVLLRATPNSKKGNDSFEAKKEMYRSSSSLELTKQMLSYETWGPDEIKARQATIADIAVQTWTLAVPK